MKNTVQCIFIMLLAGLTACQKEKPAPINDEIITLQLDPAKAAEMAQKIKAASPAKTAPGLELSLWASDSLVADPIAISIDPQGRIFYTSATRQENSEFDVRGNRHWMTASMSFQTVEDRRKFLRENFTADSDESKRVLKDLNKDGVLDWRDLTVEKEQVWFVVDESGDGVADKAQLYLEDFHEEITDVANGLEYANGEVFIGVGPDLWRSADKDGNGVADLVESISHGYAVHIGFSGHGMSGVTLGPDGRIWWGIGDIGMNVIDKSGKQWKYPNQGVIVRSEPDGSGFEVFCAGVRNTHEFVFDEYGNLITEDNDGDHPKERERLVFLINGSDSGWRHNWQFGKYTDPDNNRYKVWMDEQLSVPYWEGQAAYILPPITNYVNGPTGMVYNPGTALGERWYKHFFIAEFRGSPANSPVHAFTLKPNGAGFQLNQTQEFVTGLLPTGIDFGPDGALYIADWIDGWGTKDEGRIWKVDVPGGAAEPVRQNTKVLIEADFTSLDKNELANLLAHQDMRVRVKAQHELAKRGNSSLETLLNVANDESDQLARIHALWGIGQLARKDISVAQNFLLFLTDNDPEIMAQTAKMIGDVRYTAGAHSIVPMLKDNSPRVKLMATEALGRLAYEDAIQPILDMILANNDQDKWLRHAGHIALGRIGKEEPLAALTGHPSKAIRLAAVVGLRRMGSAKIGVFLNDENEEVTTEAARGINDDFSIEAALPALADVLSTTKFENEALIRRAINANLRVGQPKNLTALVQYANQTSAPVEMRAEAIAALSTWSNLSVFDRVDGRYRGEVKRDAAPALQAFSPTVKNLLKEKAVAVQIATAKAAAKLNIAAVTPELFELVQNSHSKEVRIAALHALDGLKANELEAALETTLADKESEVRSAALGIIPNSDLAPEKAVELFGKVLSDGSTEEQQTAFASLGTFTSQPAVDALNDAFGQLLIGHLDPAIQLDLIEAIEQQGNADLLKKLDAYQKAKPADDPLAAFEETLAGGRPEMGRELFRNHAGGQCVRCHTIYEWGGDAGPGLDNVGSRLTKKEILAALIEPSAAFAKGYGVVSLEMKDGESVAGIVEDENETTLKVKIGKGDFKDIAKSDIATRENIPSAMPPMGNVLTKKEVRDLVAYLASLDGEK